MKYLKSFKQFESSTTDIFGEISMPACVTNDPEDNSDMAYSKGHDAAEQGYDVDDNPYVALNDEEHRALMDNFDAWNTGWTESTNGTL